MKKILLSIGLGMLSFLATSQVAFNVDSPLSISGSYNFTYSNGGSWGSPDLTLPASAVIDTLAIVRDGSSSSDSLGCQTLINPTEINGKIAVVYRGDCEFGVKAKNAQDAGAVAVVIINNIAGAPIEMAGGSMGGQVTVPVVMVSDLTGATLVNAMATDDVVVFIGNKTGRFPNDLVIDKQEVIRPKYTTYVEELGTNSTSLDLQVGAWVRNYGYNTQHNIKLTCDITKDGTGVYNNVSTTIDSLPTGDSIFVTLPTYDQANTMGEYEMIYNVSSDSTESFPDDNIVKSKTIVNDKYISRGEVDPTTKMPITTGSYYWMKKTCINFIDSNASRLGVRGMIFSATATRTDSLTGKYLDITAYTWDGASTNTLNQEFNYGYDFNSDLSRENITYNFPQGFALEDNQNYLFCIENNGSDTIYLGATEAAYRQTTTTYNSVFSIFQGTNNSYANYIDIAPAITLETLPAAIVGVDKKEKENIIAYPNPAKDMISIPVGNLDLKEVVIYDLTGKIVNSQNINNVNNMLKLDVTHIPNGIYVVSLVHTDDSTSKINVVIGR